MWIGFGFDFYDQWLYAAKERSKERFNRPFLLSSDIVDRGHNANDPQLHEVTTKRAGVPLGHHNETNCSNKNNISKIEPQTRHSMMLLGVSWLQCRLFNFIECLWVSQGKATSTGKCRRSNKYFKVWCDYNFNFFIQILKYLLLSPLIHTDIKILKRKRQEM
jgi:hypothetical protein